MAEDVIRTGLEYFFKTDQAKKSLTGLNNSFLAVNSTMKETDAASKKTENSFLKSNATIQKTASSGNTLNNFFVGYAGKLKNVIGKTANMAKRLGFLSSVFAKFGKAGRTGAAGATEGVNRLGEATQATGGRLMNAAKSAVGFGAGFFALGAITGAMRGLAQQVPGIGVAFETMGRTIRNNLVWPLFKELMPVLMRVTHWVRDNRDKFVQLGGVLLGVFRAIWGVAKTLVGALIEGFKSFFAEISGGGKATFEGFMKMMNFMLFKIVFILTFLSVMIEPIISGIGEMFGKIWKNAVKPFLKGFVSGFTGPAFDALNGFLDLIKLVIKDIKSLFGDETTKGAESLGYVIGEIVGGALKLMIDYIKFSYKSAKQVWKALLEPFKELGDEGISFTKILKIIWKVFVFVFKKSIIPTIKLIVKIIVFLAGIIGKVLAGSIKFVAKAINGLKAAFEWFTVDLPSGLRRAARWFADAWTAAVNKVISVKNKIVEGFKGLIKFIVTLGKTIEEKFKKVIEEITKTKFFRLVVGIGAIIGKLLETEEEKETRLKQQAIRREEERKRAEKGTVRFGRSSADIAKEYQARQSQTNIDRRVTNIYTTPEKVGDAIKAASQAPSSNEASARKFQQMRSSKGIQGVR